MTATSNSGGEPGSATVETSLCDAALSSALVGVFRGKFCDSLLPGRPATKFTRDDVLYDVGSADRSMFFIRNGFAKIGTLTREGREIIYDVRGEGDVVGELSVCHAPRRDRAVALEPGEAIKVSYSDIMTTIRSSPDLLVQMLEIVCDALSDAYAQITVLFTHDLVNRIVEALLGLASKVGRPAGRATELTAYLTQEEISQMVAARRERVSTALNCLRRRGLIDYSARGHLLLQIPDLRSFLGSRSFGLMTDP